MSAGESSALRKAALTKSSSVDDTNRQTGLARGWAFVASQKTAPAPKRSIPVIYDAKKESHTKALATVLQRSLDKAKHAKRVDTYAEKPADNAEDVTVEFVTISERMALQKKLGGEVKRVFVDGGVKAAIQLPSNVPTPVSSRPQTPVSGDKPKA
ncbi:hypothetical protein B0T26DRAFT_676752 [Lasiosphaeria miniovina]|uniref:Uncharacterized protein n=1 Tax=Lasiosphaeria miniovina TaxID=1954250 RepID=A0AA40DZF5_9PEZI|nr:uncharacterized protein B0T26DRAFT_676752 [Lasiosphaeria miniovina]KAK0718611.1 hypothetical protein B0T26DRAFT_676752 [Lasiosphaeria miniovina]